MINPFYVKEGNYADITIGNSCTNRKPIISINNHLYVNAKSTLSLINFSRDSFFLNLSWTNEGTGHNPLILHIGQLADYFSDYVIIWKMAVIPKAKKSTHYSYRNVCLNNYGSVYCGSGLYIIDYMITSLKNLYHICAVFGDLTNPGTCSTFP